MLELTSGGCAGISKSLKPSWCIKPKAPSIQERQISFPNPAPYPMRLCLGGIVVSAVKHRERLRDREKRGTMRSFNPGPEQSQSWVLIPCRQVNVVCANQKTMATVSQSMLTSIRAWCRHSTSNKRCTGPLNANGARRPTRSL